MARYASKRTQKAQYQWIRSHFFIELTDAVPLAAQGTFQDEQDGITALTRVIRCMTTVNLWVKDFETPDVELTAAPLLTLGLVRTDPDVPDASLSVQAGTDADKAWLFRQDYRLPNQLIAASGQVNMFNEPYHLDWQLRSGKGTNVNRDVEIRWVVQARNFLGSIFVDLTSLWLVE